MSKVKKGKKSKNPLFEQWLEEWRQEAIAAKSPIQHAYSKALKTLRNLPIVVRSGQELLDLKVDYFGKNICDRLDHRLSRYNRGSPEPSSSNVESINDIAVGSRGQKRSNTNDNYDENQSKKRKRPYNNQPKLYLPKKGTGGNAILVTMYLNSQDPRYPGYMFREDIINQAQQYCDVPMKGNAINHYGGWSSMTTLIQKGYVIKKSSPAKYSLTEDGFALAMQTKIKNELQESMESSSHALNQAESKNFKYSNLQDNLVSSSSTCFTSSSFSKSSTSMNNRSYDFLDSNTGFLNDIDDFPIKQNKINSGKNSTITSNALESHDANANDEIYKSYNNADFLEFYKENTQPNFDFSQTNEHYSFSEPSDCKFKNNTDNIDYDLDLAIKESIRLQDAVNKEKSNTNKIIDNISNEPFCLWANNFDILLLVDCGETKGVNAKLDMTVSELKRTNVVHEVRRLHLGDFMWVARCRHTGKELVLPYIVERKRLDDLGASMSDGRYNEQKFRLKQCGLKNVIYLIENMKTFQAVVPLSNLSQAAINISLFDKFTVKCTRDLKDTIEYLSLLTDIITKKYDSKDLNSCKKTDYLSTEKNCQLETKLMEFTEFNKTSGKMKNFKVQEMFLKQLIQLKGLSVNMAIAITKKYPTPFILLSAFNDCIFDIEKEKMLTNIEYEDKGNRKKIGSAISKTLANFYTKLALNN